MLSKLRSLAEVRKEEAEVVAEEDLELDAAYKLRKIIEREVEQVSEVRESVLSSAELNEECKE